MDFSQREKAQSTVTHFFNRRPDSLPIYDKPIQKVITLKSILGRADQKVMVRPTKNSATGELLGVERLNKNQQEGKAYVVDPKRKLTLKDGTTFDLSDEIERIDWNWVQYSIYVVNTREDANKSPEAVFFVEDEERDNKNTLDKTTLFYDAETQIRKGWNAPERMNYARLLGHDLSMHTEMEVLNYLIEFAKQNEKNAQEILKIENDPYKRERLEVLRWKDVALVEEKAGGMWFFGEFRMGLNIDQALAWVMQAEHADVVATIRERYALLQRPNLSGANPIPTRSSRNLEPAGQSQQQQWQDNQQRLRSTSVEPIMTPPRPAATLTLDKLREVAPIGYGELAASLSPAQLAYLALNPDEEMFGQIIKDELSKSIMAYRQRQTAQPPVVPQREHALAPLVAPPQPFDDTEKKATPPAPGQFQNNGINLEIPQHPMTGVETDTHHVASEVEDVMDGDDEPEPESEQAAQADSEAAPAAAIPVDEHGQPLKGLALVNHNKQLAKAQAQNNQDSTPTT